MDLLALTVTAAHAGMTAQSFPPECFQNQEIQPNIALKGKRGSKGKHQGI